MIEKKEFFTKENIEKHKQHTSPVLAEQVVHCMELVASLSSEGLNYMFKGGNSLLVLLEEPKRFSIDVDIATDEKKEAIDGALENIVKKSDIFTGWSRRPHKTKPWLPMTSYYIYYNSHFTDPKETSIMLDVQLKQSPYKKITKPVSCGNFYYSAEKVLLPSVSSLIGDKLLTLGPATLGIPLNKNKEAQRLKHSFDVSLLASKELSIGDIRESVTLCMEQENNIQETSFSLEEVFEDTVKYCGTVVKHETEPENKDLSPYLSEIVKGRKPFEEHIFAPEYTWSELQIDLSRCALCITAVICDKITSAELTEALKKRNIKNYWDKISEWTGRKLPG